METREEDTQEEDMESLILRGKQSLTIVCYAWIALALLFVIYLAIVAITNISFLQLAKIYLLASGLCGLLGAFYGLRTLKHHVDARDPQQHRTRRKAMVFSFALGLFGFLMLLLHNVLVSIKWMNLGIDEPTSLLDFFW